MRPANSDETKSSRLTEAQLNALLDAADQSAALLEERHGKIKRDAPRLAYRRPDTKCRMTHPGGGVSDVTVMTRNLSATGMSLVYAGFVHVGTHVHVMLQRRRAGEEAVDGIVRHCRHLAGLFHVIGVRFDRKIFPGLFLDESSLGALLDETEVKPADLVGRALLIEPSATDADLLKFRLRQTRIAVDAVLTTDEGVKLVEANLGTPYDVVICEMNFADTTGEALIANLRSGGHTGPILVITSETAAMRLKTIQGVANAMLIKPYTAQDLHARLAAWLQGTSGAADEPLHTELRDPEMTSLIMNYVKSVHEMVGVLKAGMEGDDLAKVRTVCLSLKGSGDGFGFPLLSTVAREAVTALDASMSVHESARELRTLQAVARRVTAPTVTAQMVA